MPRMKKTPNVRWICQQKVDCCDLLQLTLKTVLLSAPREVDFVGLEQFQLAEKLLVRLDLDWRSFQVENFDDSVLMGGFEDLETRSETT